MGHSPLNKNAAFDTLRDALNDEADTVQEAVDLLPADQQLAAIESAGMTAATPATRLTSLPTVENLGISAGDAPTTMD